MSRYPILSSALCLVILVTFMGYQCASNVVWGSVFDQYGPVKAAEIVRSLKYVSKWCVGKPSSSAENSVSWASDLDECCRQLEEGCEDYIPANSWQYGLFNNRQFSAFLCQCEDRFINCLKQLPGSNFIARQVVAGTYFHLMRGGCFIKINDTTCDNRLFYDDDGYGYRNNPDQKYFCPMFHHLGPFYQEL